MKNLLALALLLYYSMVVLKPIVPIIDYAINYHYISTELCENVDKPEMECHGKCHLKKSLNTSTRKNKDPFVPQKRKLPRLIYISQLNPEVNYFFNESQSIHILDFNLYLISVGFSKELLNPPQSIG